MQNKIFFTFLGFLFLEPFGRPLGLLIPAGLGGCRGNKSTRKFLFAYV